jgi:hypothetical protein
MYFTSMCGYVMSNVAFPNPIAYHVLSALDRERLENFADEECAANGVIDGWPEHWEATTIEVWKCPQCHRVYVNPTGPPEEVVVYQHERVGMPYASGDGEGEGEGEN